MSAKLFSEKAPLPSSLKQTMEQIGSTQRLKDPRAAIASTSACAASSWASSRASPSSMLHIPESSWTGSSSSSELDSPSSSGRVASAGAHASPSSCGRDFFAMSSASNSSSPPIAAECKGKVGEYRSVSKGSAQRQSSGI
eukprot:CAMPEP_0181256314 /NCGR_PEP_ID=MMETSP1096-20121128/49641_1 /TAXON_ID=156174 ORGANISM="Chrysochromulina ericina, Strain CCMP281" /NCGR_SAMPLE_ID=MMETSP1096 /ASSEMBLY_ACC=CAM_ASM_000453 /LENGTH=139 /DNA_ID=CAMNT_0023354549 /DNA_START=551 /DNA_END=971 /DNA_ORIENTATION=+